MNKDKKKDLIIVAFLFLLVIIIRLPSFFYSVFDWDESTFILMGQSILNGNLPYVDTWVMKPPGSFYLYSLFLMIFGKSVLAVRVGGALFVFLASVLLYMSGAALYNRASGIIAAIFLIVFVSARKWGLSTMIEHLMLVPISLVLFIVLTRKLDNKTAFVTGLILGAGILMRQNMAFDSLAVLAVIFTGITMPGTYISERVKRCLFLVSGIAVPISAMTLYFALHGELQLFLHTNISSVVAHVIEKISLSRKLELLLSNISDEFAEGYMPLWIFFSLGISFIFFSISSALKRPVAAMLIIIVAQIYSIFYTGTSFGYHYLIMTRPVMALICGLAISTWLSSDSCRKRYLYYATVLLVAIGLIFPLFKNIVPRYEELVSAAVHDEDLDDTCDEIAEYLNEDGVMGRYVYMVNNCHIVYFLTKSKYPTRYIHPTDIIKYDYMLKAVDGPEATDDKELQKILLKKPAFIVYKAGRWPTPDDSFREMLFIELKKEYRLVKVISDNYFIYKRKRF